MKLLVSAINIEEARRSIIGGADIVDVKNPKEGSLGGQTPRIVKSIAKVLPRGMILSAAIGDVVNKPGLVSQAGLGLAVCGARYIKLGLCAGFTSKQAESLVKELVLTVNDYMSGINIVVCGYADARLHGLISVDSIPEITAKAGAKMSMIDTLTKGNGKGLFDYLDEKLVKKFCLKSKSLGLNVALAGSLKEDDIVRIFRGQYCDVIGVRSLACRGGKRSSEIQAAKVQSIKKLMDG